MKQYLTWAYFGALQDFGIWNILRLILKLTKISISETFLGCKNWVHQDIQSLKQYLPLAHFWALQDLITGIHLGPILELTKITETMFRSTLELSKFHYLKHILGPRYSSYETLVSGPFWSSPRFWYLGHMLGSRNGADQDIQILGVMLLNGWDAKISKLNSAFIASITIDHRWPNFLRQSLGYFQEKKP